MSKKSSMGRCSVYLCVALLLYLSIGTPLYAQKNELLGQYYRVMQAYAPGLTGANEFMEINVGSRRQWVGTQQAPNYNFASFNTSLAVNKANRYRNNSLRVADLSPYQRTPVRLGLGTYFMNVSTRYIQSHKAMTSIAAHVPISRNIWLSAGTSIGVYHQAIDIDNVWVLYPDNDVVYQDFINSGGRQTKFDTNLGFALTSSRFYFSYSIIDAISIHLNGFDFDPEGSNLTHNTLGGIRLSVSQRLELIPNYFIRFNSNTPLLIDAGMRAQFNETLLLGVSGRNDGSIIGFFGLDIQDHFDFGYSYEIKRSDTFLSDLHTHEITLGLKLLNWKKKKSIW